jgi:hypothetical protein
VAPAALKSRLITVLISVLTGAWTPLAHFIEAELPAELP